MSDLIQASSSLLPSGLPSNLPSSIISSIGLPSSTSLPFPISDAPQDPFYPHSTADGPVFLDNQACVCALRSAPGSSVAWRCLGNATSDIYVGESGKWYAPTNKGGDHSNAPIDDASNPPKTDEALLSDPKSDALVPLASVNPNPLTVYDNACTGINETLFSTAYYRASKEVAANQPPVDAAPCWRKGAFPVQIQNVTSWQKTGCYSGFFCPSHLSFAPTFLANTVM